MKYQNRKQTREDKKAALEAEIMEAVYKAGTLTIAEIASRVGRSKSPALRATLARMCEDKRLVAKLTPYKTMGKYYFVVGHWWGVARQMQSEMWTAVSDDELDSIGA